MRKSWGVKHSKLAIALINSRKVYYKKVFWTASYFIASCGGVTIETLKQYVQNQDSPV
ncbi:MAG: transposase [Waterburya sp.]